MIKLKTLTDYTAQIMQPERFRDYCPNGLQVEGRNQVKLIVSGVTASMHLLEAAQALGADVVLVHHGYFWRGESAAIVGIKRNRIKYLLSHNMSLLAYHLPLDAHAEFGNNVQLGRLMKIENLEWAGENNLLAHGTLPKKQSLQELCESLEALLIRKPQVIGDLNKTIKRVAWCTGAAQQYIETAIELGVDAYISGEISEQTVHLSKESGVAYIAAGHHATERFGVQALGQHLAEHFGIRHQYIEIENPV